MLSLHPVITDRPEPPGFFEAALAALTGQPISAVTREMASARNRLASPTDAAPDIEVALNLLDTLGYSSRRLPFVESFSLKDLLTYHVTLVQKSVGDLALLVQLTDGTAHVFQGHLAAGDCSHPPQSAADLIQEGKLNLEALTRHQAVLRAGEVLAPIQPPDHQFLVAASSDALQLAMRHGIGVERLVWPYWRINFPEDLLTRAGYIGSLVVCGPYHLLHTVEQYVRTSHDATELAQQLVSKVARRP